MEEPSSSSSGDKSEPNAAKSSEEEEEVSDAQVQKAIRAIIDSPPLFCSKLLGLKPFPYQIKFLEDRSPRIIVCAGRQVGKSLITAARALWFGVTRPSKTILIVSPSLAQSILMFDKILDYVLGSSILMRSVVRKTRMMIKFSNGSVIRALPCGPYGKMLRGNAADLIIADEASYMPEDVITDVAMPMLAAKNGTIILISSPCDKKHVFYRMFNSDRWSKYHFKTEDNPLVKKEFLEEQREEIGETRFRREYLAEFVEDENTYFPMSLLRSAVHVCASKDCEYCKMLSGDTLAFGDLYAGYDPGGLVDPAALVVVQRASVAEESESKDPSSNPALSKQKRILFRVVLSKTYVISKEEKKGDVLPADVYTRFTVQVSELHKRLNFRRLLVDSTGLGSPIVSHCKDLKLPAEGVTLSQNVKQEIFSNLKILLEQKRVEFPENLELLSHLNCVSANTNRIGAYVFDHALGTHDDLAYALALAVWGARHSPIIIVNRLDESKPSKREEGRS